MSRRLAAAQLGPIHRADSRESVVKRLVEDLLQRGDGRRHHVEVRRLTHIVAPRPGCVLVAVVDEAGLEAALSVGIRGRSAACAQPEKEQESR